MKNLINKFADALSKEVRGSVAGAKNEYKENKKLFMDIFGVFAIYIGLYVYCTIVEYIIS